MVQALTDDQEKALVVDHEDGFTARALAPRYGVSERTVFRILARHGAKSIYPKRRRPRKERSKPLKPVKPLQPCGTVAAYKRHMRKKEMACLPCIRANTEYEHERKYGEAGTPDLAR